MKKISDRNLILHKKNPGYPKRIVPSKRRRPKTVKFGITGVYGSLMLLQPWNPYE